MMPRPLLAWVLLACLTVLPGPLSAAEDEPGPPPDEPAQKAPEKAAKGQFKIKGLAKGEHAVGIGRKGDADVGDSFEVRRDGRPVAFAEVTELVQSWPKLAYLIGKGRPGDDLIPLVAPVPQVQLFTDEPQAQESTELKALLGDKLFVEELGEKIRIREDCGARIVVLHTGVFFMGGDPIAQPFASRGGIVVCDTLAYSHIRGEIADVTKFKEAPTLRTVREEGLTAGFPPESRIPWYGTKGKQFLARYLAGLPKADEPRKLLATDHSAQNSAILDVDLGGHLFMLDLITPTGRAGRDPGAKNKLVFVARALGAGPVYARYMPSKPEYEDLLKWLDGLAEKNKAKMARSFEAGEKKDDSIFSYTIGDKDKPLVVLAACLDGRGWPAAVALERLAEVLLDNPTHDPRIEWLLERLRIRLLPVLNPHGYQKGAAPNENGVDLDRNFAYEWEGFADKKLRGKEPFSENGSAVVRRSIEADKAVAFLDVGVDDYDAGYRIVRARDASEAQQALLHALVSVANARLRYRFVVGDKMLQLRVTRDAARPSAANWAGSKGVLAASLRICGDGEDSITNNDVAIESALTFLQTVALSREKPEPEPASKEPPKKPAKAPKKAAGG